ncbi:uncharacterized protein [Amphiura filiformis]|uniref:uncharacterized protein n=1 Tax=Amphiura filiformis TaxID=82378 RepID=UPI003B21F126
MDVIIPVEGSTNRVHLEIRKCDITLENVDALVTFRVENGLTVGKSFTVLQAAAVEEEYREKLNAVKDVIMTGAGNLKSEHRKCILHIEESHEVAKFKETIIAALRTVEHEQFHSVAFSPLIYLDDNKKARAMAKGLIEAITDFITCDKPAYLNSVLVCDHRVKYVQFSPKDPGVQTADLSFLQVASVTYKKRDPHFHDMAKKVLCDNCIIATLPEQTSEEETEPHGNGACEEESNGTSH